jgi:hypothetical protein
MENNIPWSEVITAVLFLVTVFFGGWVMRIKKALNAIKVIVIAMEDNKITKKELEEIIASIKKIIG